MEKEELLKQSVRKNLFFGGMQGELNDAFCTLRMGMNLLEREIRNLKPSEQTERILENAAIMHSTLWRAEQMSSAVTQVLLGCTGALEPCMTGVEMRTRVMAAGDFLREEIDARHWQASSNCKVPEESLWVNGDEQYVGQILSVLLTNALRCQQAGTDVCLELTAGRTLTVRDNSPQIPQNALDAILQDRFEEQFLEDSTLVGLQLYLVRLYCDAMKWKMNVESGPEETVVTIEMTEGIAQRQNSIHMHSGNRDRVLDRLRSELRHRFDGIFGARPLREPNLPGTETTE